MEIIDETNTQVQVKFTVVDGDHTYTDALYFTPEQFEDTTPEQLEEMKLARFNSWKAVITASPRVPTEEEVQAQIDMLTQQQIDTQAQLERLAPEDRMLSILQAQLAIITESISKLEQ